MVGRYAIVVILTLAAVVPGCRRRAAADPYAEEIARYRAEREASLRADDGWLTVAGLFFLQPGANSFGSDPSNAIVLPAGRAPAHAGVFYFENGSVRVEMAEGVAATLDGQPVRRAELRPAGGGRPADTLVLGRLSLFVHKSGERLAIRLRDLDSELRRTFRGCRWYPVKPEYRVVGRFIPYDAPQERKVPNILGDEERYVTNGVVAFTLAGREYRLEAFESSGARGRRLFFVFRDATSGHETYHAARFLYADPPQDGQVVLDFNKAYNPPCAFNPYTTCPLPPPQNILPVRIEAGELDYGAHPPR
jgi:uncharacterized protein (DUF1684 family)